MKAAVYYENGGPDVFRYEDAPDPVCAPGGIVIQVEAIAIEGGDVLSRALRSPGGKPYIGGYQCAGTVIEVGAAVTGFKVGDKATTCAAGGSHAARRAVDARYAWLLPPGMDVREAAIVPVTYATAEDCIFEFGRMEKGEIVLVQAGASGVGISMLQLAKYGGAKMIIATASSDERLARLKDFGMTHGINYSREDVPAQVAKLTDGHKADLIIDPVGGSVLQGSIRSSAHRGRVIWVGSAAREAATMDLGDLNSNASVTRVYTGSEIDTDRFYNVVARMLALVAKGDLKVLVDSTFPLSEAAAAHRHIESRKAVGRVLLIP